MDFSKRITLKLILIRFIGILIPQLGYIHPDEFFQGPEVAGETLGYKVTKAWEYQGPSPIRSAVFPLLISGTSFWPLRVISEWWLWSIPPCLLLALPRLLMFLFSLIHDVCLHKICSMMHLDPYPVILIFGTSFVSFVFMIRTFSNCLEASLFTLLLYLMVCAQKRPPTCGQALLIGVVLALGTFIRPTFLLFAATPIFCWCFTKPSPVDLVKILKMAACTLLTTACLVWTDTHYFRTSSEPVDVDSTIITPLNFFLYNSKPSNLKKHGLHPRYLHVLVNLPLLFGVLALTAFYQNVKRLPKVGELTTEEVALTFSWLVPLLGLSYIPHQEPRFLLPLAVPLVLCHAETVYRSNCLRLLWVLGNVACALVFGSFHQGGLVQFLLENQHLRAPAGHTTFFVSHTYMVPLHLMQVGRSGLEVQDLGRTPVEPIPGRYCKDKCLVVLPGSVAYTEDSLKSWRSQGKEMRLVRSYFPHLSMEDPPDWSRVCSVWNDTCSTWRTLLFQLSLHVYALN